MASEAYRTAPQPETTTSWEKEAGQPQRPLPESRASATHFALVNLALRLLLFASALAGVLVMVTSKQTELIPIPMLPFPIPRSAKFNHSPAFIYYIAALSVVGFYSIITSLISLFALLRPGSGKTMLYHFVVLDVLLLGIVASATGTAGGVAYIGLKGNSHSGWNKICNTFDKFCRHIAASVGVSLIASILLTLLVLFSIRSLSKKIPK